MPLISGKQSFEKFIFSERAPFNISYFYPQLIKQVIEGFSATEKEQ